MSDIEYRNEDGEEGAKRVRALLAGGGADGCAFEADNLETEIFALRLKAGELPRAGRTMSWSRAARRPGAGNAAEPSTGLAAIIGMAVVFGAPVAGFIWMCWKFKWI